VKDESGVTAIEYGLVGCLLVFIALVYFQSERHDCSVGMSVDNWFLCITRGVDLGAP
jgi:Flp pilus assembly pilin Flp